MVELRFLGGLSVEETADVLHLLTDTIKRDWRLAKDWLVRELGGALGVTDKRDRWSDFLSMPIDAVAAGVMGQARIGPRCGNYEIVSRLGAGRMSEAYRGRDHRLGPDVATKVSAIVRVRFSRTRRANGDQLRQPVSISL